MAGRLFDRLSERFGESNVFMDVDSIEPGIDFSQAIERAVQKCDVLLALIGRVWLSEIDEHGRRRLDDPDDLVVLEIKSALDRDIRVIPVLIDGAAAPRRDDLPEGLAPLARRNAIRLDHDTFRSDIGPLLNVLNQTRTASMSAPPSPARLRIELPEAEEGRRSTRQDGSHDVELDPAGDPLGSIGSGSCCTENARELYELGASVHQVHERVPLRSNREPAHLVTPLPLCLSSSRVLESESRPTRDCPR